MQPSLAVKFDTFNERCFPRALIHRRAVLQRTYRCAKAYPSLEELVKDPKVEAVFLATPAPDHVRHTLLCLAAAGAADVVSAVLRNSIVQHETPDALRGRVMSIHSLVVTSGPRLGDAEAAAQIVKHAGGAPSR